MSLATLPPELTAMGTAIEEHAAHTAEVHRALESLASSTVFEPHELEAVRTAAQLAEEAEQHARMELAVALKVWETDIVGLEGRIQARFELLKKFETCLGKYPDVFSQLAEQQVVLNQELEDTRGRIGFTASSAAPETSAAVKKSDDGHDERIAGAHVHDPGEPGGGAGPGPAPAADA
tara:strand:- start:3055 stop:3588 length:534 start_codon:yes stop_codon:yes gene_type:complete